MATLEYVNFYNSPTIFHCSPFLENVNYLHLLILLQASGQGGGASAVVGSGNGSENRKSSVNEKEGTLERRGGTLESKWRRDAQGGSSSNLNSRGLEDSYSGEREKEKESKKQDSVATLTQDFCPVTLTVNGFFRQVHTCIQVALKRITCI